jgi:hypothetical protein
VETSYLFGGSVRAGTLETLALTSKPLSAYRVARIVGAQPIQVLRILKALEPDVVRREAGRWVLANDDLRRFLRSEVARRESQRRAEKDELLTSLGLRPRSVRGRQ